MNGFYTRRSTERSRGQSVAAAAAVPAAVSVPRRGLAVFGPPAEDLVGAVVATATGHARRGVVDLKPRREIKKKKKRSFNKLL